MFLPAFYPHFVKIRHEPALTVLIAVVSDACQSSILPATVTVISPSILINISALIVSTLTLAKIPAVLLALPAHTLNKPPVVKFTLWLNAPSEAVVVALTP